MTKQFNPISGIALILLMWVVITPLHSTADGGGHTPLHWAAWSGHADVVSVLLTAGAEIEALDDDGHTPLHLAAEKGRVDVVSVLIAAGAEIGTVFGMGYTPHDMAQYKGHRRLAKMLKQAANP